MPRLCHLIVHSVPASDDRVLGTKGKVVKRFRFTSLGVSLFEFTLRSPSVSSKRLLPLEVLPGS